MPYVNWHLASEIAAEQLWIPHRAMNELVTDLLSLNFSVVAERQAGLQAVRAVMTMPNILIRDETRFPNGRYVTLGDRRLFDLLTEMVNVLSYRDMQKDTTDTMRNLSAGKQSVESKKDEQVGWHYNDASVSFTRKLQTLHNHISDTRHVYVRSTFELAHNLDWQDPAGPGP